MERREDRFFFCFFIRLFFSSPFRPNVGGREGGGRWGCFGGSVPREVAKCFGDFIFILYYIYKNTNTTRPKTRHENAVIF